MVVFPDDFFLAIGLVGQKVNALRLFENIFMLSRKIFIQGEYNIY